MNSRSTLTIAALGMLIGALGGTAVFVLGQGIQRAGLNPFERGGAIAAYGSTAHSPYGSSPQAVSPAPPLQSTIAGEQP